MCCLIDANGASASAGRLTPLLINCRYEKHTEAQGPRRLCNASLGITVTLELQSGYLSKTAGQVQHPKQVRMLGCTLLYCVNIHASNNSIHGDGKVVYLIPNGNVRCLVQLWANTAGVTVTLPNTRDFGPLSITCPLHSKFTRVESLSAAQNCCSVARQNCCSSACSSVHGCVLTALPLLPDSQWITLTKLTSYKQPPYCLRSAAV